MRYLLAVGLLLGVVTGAMAANPLGPVNVPSMPGYVVNVTPSNTAVFPPSVLVISDAPSTITATPASPSGAADIVWTTTVENFVVPGLYRAVKLTGTTSTNIKRIQINE